MLYLPALLIHRFACPIKNALRSFRRTRLRVLQPSSRWGRLTLAALLHQTPTINQNKSTVWSFSLCSHPSPFFLKVFAEVWVNFFPPGGKKEGTCASAHCVGCSER